SDLRDQLVRRHAHRGLELRALEDPRLDGARDRHLIAVQGAARGHVEEGFVEREALDQRRDLVKHREHFAGYGLIVRHARRDADGLRAQLQRAAHGHRRVHAVAAHHVVRRRDHAAAADAYDDHRLAAHCGLVAFLDRRLERVHVDVQDGALAPGAHQRVTTLTSAVSTSVVMLTTRYTLPMKRYFRSVRPRPWA